MKLRGLFSSIVLVFLLVFIENGHTQTPYRIMLTNDDGYDAPGIMALYNELSSMPNTEVMIVAPDVNYSGAGHWVNLREPFFVVDIRQDDRIVGHHVNVPPASCVAIGVRSLMKPKPDLVISGINRGANAGLVTLSSGTVAGAREGAMNGIPAIAVSLDRPRSRQALEYTRAAQYARKIVEAVRKDPLPFGVFLNVNIPSQDKEVMGIRTTRQSNRDLEFEYIEQTSPFGRKFYWQTRKRVLESAEEGTDEWAMTNGYVSVTPFQINQTADMDLEALKALNK